MCTCVGMFACLNVGVSVCEMMLAYWLGLLVCSVVRVIVYLFMCLFVSLLVYSFVLLFVCVVDCVFANLLVWLFVQLLVCSFV